MRQVKYKNKEGKERIMTYTDTDTFSEFGHEIDRIIEQGAYDIKIELGTTTK